MLRCSRLLSPLAFFAGRISIFHSSDLCSGAGRRRDRPCFDGHISSVPRSITSFLRLNYLCNTAHRWTVVALVAAIRVQAAGRRAQVRDTDAVRLIALRGIRAWP